MAPKVITSSKLTKRFNTTIHAQTCIFLKFIQSLIRDHHHKSNFDLVKAFLDKFYRRILNSLIQFIDYFPYPITIETLFIFQDLPDTLSDFQELIFSSDTILILFNKSHHLNSELKPLIFVPIIQSLNAIDFKKLKYLIKFEANQIYLPLLFFRLLENTEIKKNKLERLLIKFDIFEILQKQWFDPIKNFFSKTGLKAVCSLIFRKFEDYFTLYYKSFTFELLRERIFALLIFLFSNNHDIFQIPENVPSQSNFFTEFYLFILKTLSKQRPRKISPLLPLSCSICNSFIIADFLLNNMIIMEKFQFFSQFLENIRLASSEITSNSVSPCTLR